jgi:hypothetical protein
MNPIMVDIYCLCDPDTLNIHYVGQTCMGLNTRLSGHVSDNSKGRKRAWLDKLKEEGKRPVIKLLERVVQGQCVAAEKFWISCFRWLGLELYNVGNGGEQIYKSLEYYQNNKENVMSIENAELELLEDEIKERWLIVDNERGKFSIIHDYADKKVLFEAAEYLQRRVIALESTVRSLSQSVEDALNGTIHSKINGSP